MSSLLDAPSSIQQLRSADAAGKCRLAAAREAGEQKMSYSRAHFETRRRTIRQHSKRRLCGWRTGARVDEDHEFGPA